MQLPSDCGQTASFYAAFAKAYLHSYILREQMQKKPQILRQCWLEAKVSVLIIIYTDSGYLFCRKTTL